MVDVKGKPEFPPLLRAVETRCFGARQSASAIWARIVFLLKNRKPTVPYAELFVLLFVLALAFS